MRAALCLALLLLLCSAAVISHTQEIDTSQQVAVATSMGSFVLSFFPDKVPLHVKLFLSRVAAGAYDGTSFSYVVKWGVVQGGARLARNAGREFAPDPVALGDVRAETSFFICLGDASNLDGQYTVFGKVVDGMEVLDRYQNVPVDGEAPRERLELRKVILAKKSS